MIKDLLQAFLGKGSEKPDAALLERGIGMLLNPEGPVGGIGGLLKILKNNGLEKIVNSWIGVGKNRKISGRQLKKGLGPDIIAGIAKEIGLSEKAVGSQIARLLPGIVDKLTPRGKIPVDEGDLLEKGLEVFKELF